MWTKFRAFGTAKRFINVSMGHEADLPATEATALSELVDADKLKPKLIVLQWLIY